MGFNFGLSDKDFADLDAYATQAHSDEQQTLLEPTENFGAFDSRMRPDEVLAEMQNANEGTDSVETGPLAEYSAWKKSNGYDGDWEDVGNWLGDAWQNNFSEVPEEDSGISNTGAPEQMQGDLAHVPTDSYQYALKHAMRTYYPEATKAGHNFDIFQDKNSGKYAYTDPTTNQITWVEPPGIESGDWADDGVVMAMETIGGIVGGIVGGTGCGGNPYCIVAGTATGSGLATSAYLGLGELDELRDKGYLDPAIYGTTENPNDVAKWSEAGYQGGISAVGSVVGDTFVSAGSRAYRKSAQRAPLTLLPGGKNRAANAALNESILEATRMQKLGKLGITNEDFKTATSGNMLNALARRLRIDLGNDVLGKTSADVISTTEQQAVSTTAKTTLPDDYSQMTDADEAALSALGGDDLKLNKQQQEEITRIRAIEKNAVKMEQLVSQGLNTSGTTAALNDKLLARTTHLRKRFETMLVDSGIDKALARKLGQKLERDYNRDIHQQVLGRYVSDQNIFTANVGTASKELNELVEGMLTHTANPDKLGMKIQSVLGTAEGVYDSMVSQQYQAIFQGRMPSFDTTTLLDGDSKLAYYATRLENNPASVLEGDAAFVDRISKRLIEPANSSRAGEFKVLSYEALDDMIRSIRKEKRNAFAANKEKVSKKVIMDVLDDLVLLRNDTLITAAGDNTQKLNKILNVEKTVRAGRESFDSDVIEKILGYSKKEGGILGVLKSAGEADRGYIKELMDSYIGTTTRKTKLSSTTTVPDSIEGIGGNTYNGQDLYDVIKKSFMTDYNDNILTKDLDLGEGASLIGVDRDVLVASTNAHNKWYVKNQTIIEQLLDPADAAVFKNAGTLSKRIHDEKRIIQSLNKKTGASDTTTIFKKTYGPERYQASEDIYQLLHNPNGSVKDGAQDAVDKYKLLIFNDMAHDSRHGAIKINDKTDPSIIDADYVDSDILRAYVDKRRNSMEMWLGADKMKEVDDVVRLAEMAKLWSVNRKDSNSNRMANALNGIARAYVGMFTRPGRMLTAGKQIHGSRTDSAAINKILDIELAANRITYGEVGIIRRGLAWMSGKEVLQPRQEESEINYQKKKDGGIVHGYELPTLKRPERMDDMMQEGLKEAAAKVQVLRANGREAEAVALEREIERVFLEANQNQDMQLPGEPIDDWRNKVQTRELAELERTAEMGNDYAQGGIVKGYAQGGYVTQDQMQGMMQQMSGIQPTLQAVPITPPIQEDTQPMVPTVAMSAVEQQPTVMTKKQKEKAKVKAVKKGNKRHTMALPPKTGILSGF